MSLTASQIFDLLAPSYKDDADKDSYLSLAAMRTSSCSFGPKYNEAVALRAAHLIELAKGTDHSGSGGSGPVTGKKEGQLSISYGASSGASNDDLTLTKYGKQLKALIRSTVLPFGVTGGNSVGCL